MQGFPNILKQVNTTPDFRKSYGSSKENYRSVSVLLVITKIFEKFLGKQLTKLVYK